MELESRMLEMFLQLVVNIFMNKSLYTVQLLIMLFMRRGIGIFFSNDKDDDIFEILLSEM